MREFPLTRQNRIHLARTFSKIPAVDISIDCVIEDQMGKAFADSVDAPTVFMIEQDQFFCYFAGDVSSAAGKAFLSAVPNGRMLLSGSAEWHDLLPEIYSERLATITRYSFSEDALNLEYLNTLASANPHTPNVQRIDATIAETDFRYFEIGAFESFEDYEKRGIGFCMMQVGKVMGVAYSSLVCSDAIEISIFVDQAYRRQGVATALACQLLIWCLERDLNPHWDAANQESCQLAEKLGYTNRSEYRAYFLRKG